MTILRYIFTFTFTAGAMLCAAARQPETPPEERSPIETVSRVADKVLRDAKFYYNLKLAGDRDYGSVQTLDFGRNFQGPGCAYALSTVEVPRDTVVLLSIVNYGGCRVILNDREVWSHGGMTPDDFRCVERDYLLKGEVRLPLRAGVNRLLIKSESPAQGEWKVYLRAWGFLNSLTGLKEVEASLSQVSRWLMAGPWPAGTLARQEAVEREFVSGKIYRTDDGRRAAWILPRLEMVAANAEIHQPGNEGYTAFNYHAAGLAMAMEILGRHTGEEKYSDYNATYCDFYLEKRDYMAWQKFELNSFNAWDHRMVKGYLLDYTSAPMLPYAERLLNLSPGERDSRALDLFDEMKQYVVHEQTRTPEGNFNRITPQPCTVWVDDMYMGLPFLVQAARLTDDAAERKQLTDDAVRQVFAFNEYVWNPDARLYQHGQFTDRRVRMPHWSRGNGWALWAVSNLLACVPTNHPQYKRLLAHYRDHVESLVRWQDGSGLWRNVLDHPGAFLETSGSAIFTVCIARGIRNGWLPAKKYLPVVKKAWAGIETMIDTEYEVHGITVGTHCTSDVDYYLNRATCINDCHGLFPVIIAGVELDKLLKGDKF